MVVIILLAALTPLLALTLWALYRPIRSNNN